MIKRLTYVLIGISLLLFITSLTVLYLNLKPLQEYELQTSVNVTIRGLGFDVNDSALTYGNVVQGGSSSRNLIFSNEYDFPVALKLTSNGEMKDFLFFQKTIQVSEGNNLSIPITVNIPLDQEPGKYTGKIIVSVFRSRY